MFKKLKDKEVYKKFKDNPQFRAQISLGFWLIVFVIIVLFARGSVGTYNPNSFNEVKTNVKSYEYAYSNDNLKVFGFYYNSKQQFIINNEKFYYDGSSVYKVVDYNLDLILNFDLSILKIDYDFIIKITEGITPVKSSVCDRYIIPLTKFIGLYDVDTPLDLSGLDAYNVIIDEYYQNEVLNMVKIDLTSYYNYRGFNNDGILTIDFYNMNNVNDFTKEYERIMKVVR